MKPSLKLAALAAVTLPALAAANAQHPGAQRSASLTGVSRPQEVPVTTSADGISQPVVYEDGSTPGYIPTPPTLKTRVTSSASTQKPSAGEIAGAAVPVPAPAAARTYEPGQEITTSNSAYVPYTAAGSATAASTSVVTEARVEAKPALHADAIDKVDAEAVRESDHGPNSSANPDGEVVLRVPGPSNQLPVGTILKVATKEVLTTRHTVAGSEFHGTLTEAVVRDGKVLLPAGSQLDGRVTNVHGGRRISGSASIRLVPTRVTLPDGTSYAMRAQVIDTDLYRSTRVNSEGEIVRKGHPREGLAVIGLASGSGAAAGGILGGVPGALIGAGVGAGVSTAVWLKEEHQQDVPAGTTITFALSSPLNVGAE